MHSQKSVTSPASSASSEEVPAQKTILMAVYNMKGGVGKTTSSLELAYHLVRDGFRVLLVDADMQANLTMNTLMAAQSVADKDSSDAKEDEDSDLIFDDATDRLWKRINEREKTGNKLTFYSIVKECTGARLFIKREGEDSLLSKIEPLTADVGLGRRIDYIAGDMRTGDLDQKIIDGFRVGNSDRYPVPGLVTNVFREYGEQQGYDFVIFDLGCTLTATVKAVLLGSDYFISPFKCERACKTAAEIVIKKMRDFHRKWNHVRGAANVANPDCVLTVKEGCAPASVDEIPVALKCYPRFLGAFPLAVKAQNHAPTRAYQTRIDEIMDRYEVDLNGFSSLGLSKPDLTKLKALFIENSESAGKEVEGGGAMISRTTMPCVSLCNDVFRIGKTAYKWRSFLNKADAISRQYQAVLKALVANMHEHDQAYLASKSSRLFKAGGVDEPEPEKMAARDVLSLAAGAKRKRSAAPETASVFSLRILRSGKIPEMPGYTVKDVKGDGNCFFYAAVDQLQIIHHPYMDTIPAGTEPHDSLRLLAQQHDFQDAEWAGHAEIIALANALNIAVRIVDTRQGDLRGVYHFVNHEAGIAGDSTMDLARLPAGMPVIELLYTGNHYMSLIKDPVAEHSGPAS